MEDKDLEARKTLEYYDSLDRRYGVATVYQEHAMRTVIAQSAEGKLHHGVFGLASEAGEVAGILQKAYQGHGGEVAGILQKAYQGHGDPFESDEVKLHLIKECGDCLWMIAEILESVGYSMGACMKMNIDKLRGRYPEGFDPEKSLNRKEGDI